MAAPHVDELFAASEERDEQGAPLAGLKDVASALGVPLAGAREWAWASGVTPRDGRLLVTRAQAAELASDPDGRRALHAEVARLRVELRIHQHSAARRAEAAERKRVAAAHRREAVERLKEGNRRKR